MWGLPRVIFQSSYYSESGWALVCWWEMIFYIIWVLFFLYLLNCFSLDLWLSHIRFTPATGASEQATGGCVGGSRANTPHKVIQKNLLTDIEESGSLNPLEKRSALVIASPKGEGSWSWGDPAKGRGTSQFLSTHLNVRGLPVLWVTHTKEILTRYSQDIKTTGKIHKIKELWQTV